MSYQKTHIQKDDNGLLPSVGRPALEKVNPNWGLLARLDNIRKEYSKLTRL